MSRFLDFLLEGKLPQTRSPFLNRLGSLGSGLSNPNMFAGARSIFQALNPNHNFAGSHGWMNQTPTGMNAWGPMRNGYQVGPNFNSGMGPSPGGVPFPSFTDWMGEAGQQPSSQQQPDQIFSDQFGQEGSPPRPQQRPIDSRGSRPGSTIIAQRTDDVQNNRDLENMAEGLLGQTVSQRNAQQAQMARAAMDRMFGRSYK